MAENENKLPLNASVAPEDFNWEAFEETDVYGGSRKAEIEAEYDRTLSRIVEGEVVEGEVTSINKREVVVTIGGKSEGVIPATDFRYNADLKVGDKVEV
ncbi:MAG: S1 RNA-binding domain-containing protein, partial [Bacteroidales bacterium]|nr:S1 RNA-binding domain-containing protein [Bacteroidales bacterium]